jgi:hypothetical protein
VPRQLVGFTVVLKPRSTVLSLKAMFVFGFELVNGYGGEQVPRAAHVQFTVNEQDAV